MKVGYIRDTPGGGHIDLAGGQPVLAAGEVRVGGGRIKEVNNASGHYEPSGSSAQSAAALAFQRAGFPNVNYVERIWVPHPTLPHRGNWAPVSKTGG